MCVCVRGTDHLGRIQEGMDVDDCESVLLDLQAATAALDEEDALKSQVEELPQEQADKLHATTATEQGQEEAEDAALDNATVLSIDGCYGSTPMDLGRGVMGQSTSKPLVVRNTTAKQQAIRIDRFPFSKGFMLTITTEEG